MKKFILVLHLAAAGVLSPALAEPAPPPAALSAAPAEFASLLRAYPSGGDGLATGVEELLNRDAAAAIAIARQAKKINCDQAAAVALGVSRVIAAVKRMDRERVKKIYRPFESACSNCSDPLTRKADAVMGEDERRVCRAREVQDPANPTRIRNARGEDCFCSLIAALAAQTYAQGDAGERMGFFADELSGNGGAGGVGGWIGQNVSGN